MSAQVEHLRSVAVFDVHVIPAVQVAITHYVHVPPVTQKYPALHPPDAHVCASAAAVKHYP